jgi:ABC-type proline/glycine betaine transport system permease subunit
MILGALLGALVNLGGTGRYIHWGFIQISVANLVVIGLMVVVFVLAILLPFPKRKRDSQ